MVDFNAFVDVRFQYHKLLMLVLVLASLVKTRIKTFRSCRADQLLSRRVPTHSQHLSSASLEKC